MSITDSDSRAAGSTATCLSCGHRPNAAYQLYAELSNDKASWTDAVFWLVAGSVVGAGVQVAIEWGMKELGLW